MTVLIALIICTALYLFARNRTKHLGNASSIEIYATSALRTVSAISAFVGVFFLVIQEVMRAVTHLDWTNVGLLTVERALVAVRLGIDITLSSPYMLVLSGVLLVLIIAFHLLGIFSNSIRTVLHAVGWFARVNIALIILTSFTFFGTGSLSGLPNLEARLVDDRTKIERGLTELAAFASDAATVALQDAGSAVLHDQGVHQLLSEATDYEEIADKYPFIVLKSYIQDRELFSGRDESTRTSAPPEKRPDSTRREVVRFVSRAISRPNVSVIVNDLRSGFVQGTALTDVIDVDRARVSQQDITLDQLERATSSLRQPRASTSDQSLHKAEYDAFAKALDLSINLASGQLKAQVPRVPTVDDPLVGVLLVLLDETISEGLNKIRREIAKAIFDSVVLRGEQAHTSFQAGKKLATDRFLELFRSTINPRLDVALDGLRNQRNALMRFAAENDRILRDASLSFRRTRVEPIIAELYIFAGDIARNHITAVGLSGLQGALERSLLSLSAREGAELLEQVGARVRTLRERELVADASIRVEQLINFEREFGLGTHFNSSIAEIVSATMAVEYRGKWGRVRSKLEDAVDSGRLNVSRKKKRRAAQALLGWREERRRLALQYAFSQTGAGSLSMDMFENAFARYLKRTPEMTALWGFGVIDVLDTGEFSEYVERDATEFARNQLQKHPDATARQFAEAYKMEYSEWKAMYPIFPDGLLAREILKGYARSVGPKPADGYLHYMKKTHMQADKDAWNWVISKLVNDAIDRICPK